ncbi:Shieldin complex subunit 3 [Merluccius polli]|uniref:Shieldin complex subunit 3 n=1 Tax=Merluccius polli TaxID=89951 RepID=A0AA47P606_MERPO|nr:Shieldin complex subunit 3 [Merluccius polli]
MEDVVLHYKPADAGQLSSLVWRTETALEPFPCRVLPTFTPWFPSTSDRWLPIRPSKPAPPAHVVTQKTQEDDQTLRYSKHLTSAQGSGDPTSNFKSDAKADTTAHPEYNYKQDIPSLILVNRQHETNPLQKPTYAVVITNARSDNQSILSCSNVTQSTRPPQGAQGKSKDSLYIPKPPHTPLPPLVPVGKPSPPNNTSPDAARLSPEKQTPRHVSGTHIRDGGVKRSWSVVAHSGLPLQSTPSLSVRFHKMVTKHGLHLRQRARWLIGQHNWVSSGDMEQVWWQLNRSIKSSSLPTCNANIQREQRQIWVFCDVLCSEHVGKHLKQELALSGPITLSVPKLGDILTL